MFETPSLITSLDVLTACLCSLSPDEVFTFPAESAGLSLDSMRPSPVSPVYEMKVQEDCITDEEEKQDVTGFGDRNRDDTVDNRLLTLRSQAQTTTKARNSNTELLCGDGYDPESEANRSGG